MIQFPNPHCQAWRVAPPGMGKRPFAKGVSAHGGATTFHNAEHPRIFLCPTFNRYGSMFPNRSSFRRPICPRRERSEEHTSELQSLMRNSYAVFCLQKKK